MKKYKLSVRYLQKVGACQEAIDEFIKQKETDQDIKIWNKTIKS